jgi:ERO1-like protein beta
MILHPRHFGLAVFAPIVVHTTASHASVSGAGSSPALFSESLLRKGQVQTVLEHKPVTHTECRQAVRSPLSHPLFAASNPLSQTTGPIETTTCDFETVESVNDQLYHHLHDLVQTPFFKYFRVCAPAWRNILPSTYPSSS